MKLSGSTAKVQLPMESQIEGQLLKKNKEMMQQEGKTALKLIETAGEAAEFINNPLPSGNIGTRINIKV